MSGAEAGLSVTHRRYVKYGDAHTVGIDAILNVKGHAGEKGLEYYREIRVVNMGAQVEIGRAHV